MFSSANCAKNSPMRAMAAIISKRFGDAATSCASRATTRNESRVEGPCRQVPTWRPPLGRSGAAIHPGHRTLEHVPKKLLAFFDSDMVQLFDFERVLIDQMILFDRDALYRQLWRSPGPREGCKTTLARRPAWRKPGRKGLFARACR